MQEPVLHNVSIGRTASDMSMDHGIQSLESSTGAEVHLARSREPKTDSNSAVEAARSWTNYPEKTDASLDGETVTGTPRLDFSRFLTSDRHNTVGSTTEESVQEGDMIVNLSSIKTSLQTDNGLSIPQLLHQVLMEIFH
jgi:CLIP-associating protein 1/2